MAKMINFTVNGLDVTFHCDSRNTRNGFAHDAELWVNGNHWGTGHGYYLNRTWEYWTYQSACMSCCSDLIEKRKADLKRMYKDEHGISRVAGKKAKELTMICEFDEEIKNLKAIREVLNSRCF